MPRTTISRRSLSSSKRLAIPMKKFDRPMLGFLTRQEMQAILEAPDATSWAGRRDRAFFSVIYNTGARVSEAIGLRVGDVVTESSPTAHLRGKGRKQRSYPYGVRQPL